MTTRTATATWQGTLKDGNGVMKVGSGLIEGPFTFASRFETGEGTNPEELIGAAHAGCFSMFLSALLSGNGYTPESINTTASVTLGKDDTGPLITLIELETEAVVPGLGEEEFQELVATAKANCPISRALAATESVMKSATLVG
ncbi:MAG TPA: OsmC family peroxiredoxin [Anaerolineae bacterium]|nr:OsmC family peroxiredoxin [Anaerolineae bacterium]HIP69849.1 OsmC family peroxiredoxin [Anaerolineae bacterium]